MRDKSNDERFFILTLLGIAKEAEKLGENQIESVFLLKISEPMQKDMNCFIKYRRKAGSCLWKRKIRL